MSNPGNVRIPRASTDTRFPSFLQVSNRRGGHRGDTKTATETTFVREQLALSFPRSGRHSPGRHRSGYHGLRILTLLAAMTVGATGVEALGPYRQDVVPGLAAYDAGERSAPALGDLDGDGDLDVVIGGNAIWGELRYLKNTGGPAMAAFVDLTETDSPFSGISAGVNPAPALADMDADGDLDAVVGSLYGNLRYWANTGSSTLPAYAELTGTANPLDGFTVGSASKPTLADLDGDGDGDLVAGEGNGTLRYFVNTGSSTHPAFVEATGTANPLSSFDAGTNSAPTLVDLDGDADFDAVVGEQGGAFFYLINTGSSNAPAFLEATGSAHPFSTFDVGQRSSPVLADLDDDGDLDAVVGEEGGTLQTFSNTGSSTSPVFVEITGTASIFKGFDVGYFSTLAMVDLDGDGDLDAVVGESFGTLRYFVNTGAATAPGYIEATGTLNPLSSIDVSYFSAPALADLDGDGDLDCLVSEYYGALLYFRNTGTSTAPAFVELTGSSNVFSSFNVGYRARPALVDLDTDGDTDLVVGRSDGDLLYFRNTGNATNAAFVEITGTANPFSTTGVSSRSAPALADLDRDGDLDAIVGDFYGVLHYFKNTGSPTSPAFVEIGYPQNTLLIFDAGLSSAPALADIDNDGDIDAIVGEHGGSAMFVRSFEAVFSDGFESGSTAAWSATVP